MPQVGRDLKSELAGKVVLDTGNPYPNRDGDMAVEATRKGTGVASAEFLPGVRLVAPSTPSVLAISETRHTAKASELRSHSRVTMRKRSVWWSDW